MRDFFLSHNIGAGISEWTVHAATSSRVANHFRFLRHLSVVYDIFDVSKL